MMLSKRKTDMKDIIKKKPKLSSIRKHEVERDKTKKKVNAKSGQHIERTQKVKRVLRKKAKSVKPVKVSRRHTKSSKELKIMLSKRKTDMKDMRKKKFKLSSFMKHDVGSDKTKKRIHAKSVQYRKREKKSNKSPRSKSEKPVKYSVGGTKASKRIQSRVKTDMKDIKRREPDIIMSTYIEKERQKMLLNKESLESIENEVYQEFKRYKDFISGQFIAKAICWRFLPHLLESDIFTESPSSTSRVYNDSLMEKLIALLKNWNVDLYQKCMEEYYIKKKTYPLLWTSILLKIIPRTMLEHCFESDIIADFFHCICKDYETRFLVNINDLVYMNASYMQFFLMNMASVNRVEYSTILENDRWQSTKWKLIERAFVTGQVANLQLLLQYFRPSAFWLYTDTEFIQFESIFTRRIIDSYLRLPASREHRLNRILSSYNGNYTLLNIVRVAKYVTESYVPKEISADCIRLLWRASETPYITLGDVDDAFKPLHHTVPLCFRSKPNVKELLIEAYPKECFVEYYQPRSLMHLSRCKIRRAVTSAVHVHFLPLPQKLKAYINLEW